MKTKDIIRGIGYILPNYAISYDDMLSPNNKSMVQHLMSVNGLSYDDLKTEKFVQLRLRTGVGDSLWLSEGFTAYPELDGWRPRSDYIPASLLKGYNDGDVVTFNLPIIKNDKDNDIKMETTIKVSIHLDQSKATSCGNFAETLVAVTQQ